MGAHHHRLGERRRSPHQLRRRRRQHWRPPLPCLFLRRHGADAPAGVTQVRAQATRSPLARAVRARQRAVRTAPPSRSSVSTSKGVRARQQSPCARPTCARKRGADRRVHAARARVGTSSTGRQLRYFRKCRWRAVRILAAEARRSSRGQWALLSTGACTNACVCRYALQLAAGISCTGLTRAQTTTDRQYAPSAPKPCAPPP